MSVSLTPLSNHEHFPRRTRLSSCYEQTSWATRALKAETIDFRFRCSLEIDLAAGPNDSLHYYLYNGSASWSAMKLDPWGIPRYCGRLIGESYHPAYIAWYGLANLGHYLRCHDELSLNIFLKQVGWLASNVVVRDDGAAIWPVTFDCQEGSTHLRAPWISSYIQGLVISALIRGWRITQQPYLLELCKKSTKVFWIDSDHGGVRDIVNGHVHYAECPGHIPPGPLDGFAQTLLGLYDLLMEISDSEIEQLFVQGVDGLKFMLPKWDYRKKWSWYSSGMYLSPPAYHNKNRALLQILALLTGESCFSEYAVRWDPDCLSTTGSIEIFLAFLFTKNACRLKYQTWSQKSSAANVSVSALAFPQRHHTDQIIPSQDMGAANDRLRDI